MRGPRKGSVVTLCTRRGEEVAELSTTCVCRSGLDFCFQACADPHALGPGECSGHASWSLLVRQYYIPVRRGCMLTCVNKIRAATVAAAAAGRWREALGRVARIRGSASPCGFSSGPKTARPSAVFCSGPRRPERTLARARTLARSSPGNAFRVPGGVLGKQRAFRLRLPPGREAGPAIVVSASIGEPHWPPQGGARQNRN